MLWPSMSRNTNGVCVNVCFCLLKVVVPWQPWGASYKRLSAPKFAGGYSSEKCSGNGAPLRRPNIFTSVLYPPGSWYLRAADS